MISYQMFLDIFWILDVSLLIFLLVMEWREETAVGRWYRVEARKSRERRSGRATLVEPKPEVGQLAEVNRE